MISKADYPLIPEEAFLYFPQQQEIKIGEGKTGLRRIFEGQVEYDEYEKKQLNDFQQYLVKKEVTLTQWWDDAKKLRFLYANQFKFDKALKTMEVHQEWRGQQIPPKETPEVKQFLEKGAFYVHGRDHRFRPILVINVKRFDFKNIENWVVILDLGNIGLSSLPISGLKQVMGYLSSNYRSRMFATYVVHTPSSIFIPYKIIKGFLEEQTIKKISFYSNGNPKPLFTHCHPSQIEKIYSGESNPITNTFWPPKVISDQYQIIEDVGRSIFQSKDEYSKQYKSGMLKRNITLKEHIENSMETNQVNPESVHLISFTQNKNKIQSTSNIQDTYTPKYAQNFEFQKQYEPLRSLNLMSSDVMHSINIHPNQISNSNQVGGQHKPKSNLGAFGKELRSNHQIDEFDEEEIDKSNQQIKLPKFQNETVCSSNVQDVLSVANEMYIEKTNDEPSINLVIVKRNYFNQNTSNQSFYSHSGKTSAYHSNFTKILQSFFMLT